MKVVMTLRTRDQADVVDAAVAFHLNAGVDFVIATDHRSQDGTDEILAAYARDGVLRLIREPGEEVRGGEWRTRMARLAAVEHGADWIFGADGDELWWPRGGSLKDVLAAVPERFGIVGCPMREFVARPEDGSSFAERMTVRFSSPAPVNDPTSAFRPQLKVAHRAVADVIVHRGSHAAYSTSLRVLPGWHPIEVLHFSARGEEQLEQKVVAWRHAVGERAHRAAHEARKRGRFSEHYAARIVGDADLRVGLERGVLAIDTRARDALRELRLAEPAGARGFRLPSERGGLGLVFAASGIADEAGWAAECQALQESLVVRFRRDADLLAARVGALARDEPRASLRARADRRRRPVASRRMKLALTLVSDDQAAVLDAVVAYHLDAGVDLVVVLDRATDARTTETLEAYVRAGYVHLLHEPGGDDGEPAEQRARLARLAASDLGASWVLWGAPNELWWPRGASLKEVLDAVPARYGLLRGHGRVLLPRRDDGRHVAERATLRRRPDDAAGSPAHPGVGRIAHRAGPELRLDEDGSSVGSAGLLSMRAWSPLEVLVIPPRGTSTLGDEQVQWGLEDGSLVTDTRLRDALRTLAGVSELSPDQAFGPPAAAGEGRVSFPRPSVVEEALYALESTSVDELELERARQSLDELDARVAALEAASGRPLAGVVRRLARSRRGSR